MPCIYCNDDPVVKINCYCRPAPVVMSMHMIEMAMKVGCIKEVNGKYTLWDMYPVIVNQKIEINAG